MSSLKQDFDELVTRIKQGREFQHASFEPIYYLVFSPKQIIEVKRQTKAWIQMLQKQGWNVHTFSIAEHVNDISSRCLHSAVIYGSSKMPPRPRSGRKPITPWPIL